MVNAMANAMATARMNVSQDELVVVDGRGIARSHELSVDVVVVGSGPAGAQVARELARAGLAVVVLEEGPCVRPQDFSADSFGALARLYREFGAQPTLGAPAIPLVQGRAVGGTSVINGAISWRLPRDVHDAWLAADPALGEVLSFDALTAHFERIERELCIAPTDPAVAGPHNLLLARGAEALGLEHRPIRRNVRGCRGLGRCLEGCPEGHKLSMDQSYLPQACAAGARIYSEVRVERVLLAGRRASGVVARAAGGGRVTVRAGVATVLAASALQTPLLLARSGLTQGPLGRGFQCHPGVAVSGRFAERVELWRGATQGHEVIGLRREGIKIEALGYDLALAATRVPGYGRAFVEGLADLAQRAHWGAAIRARARGRVRRGPAGRPLVVYSLTPEDLRLVRRGVRVLGELLFAAGAESVAPGVHGFAPTVTSPRELAALESHGPRSAHAYTMAATHLFGTCRAGSDPARSVVRPDLRHHHVERLYVADSSVFPSNTGVNPQTSILAVAALCAERVLADREDAAVRSDAAPVTSSVTSSVSSSVTSSVTAPVDAPVTAPVTAADLCGLSRRGLAARLRAGYPIAPEALADTEYLGTSLGLPKIADRLLWKRFRKTFYRRPDSGELVGWNVRVEQGGACEPLRRPDGEPLTFGPYRVIEAPAKTPGLGAHGLLLDYGAATHALDPLHALRDPLVAVNAGSVDLLLGWSYLALGPLSLPTPSYFVLERDRPLTHVAGGRAAR